MNGLVAQPAAAKVGNGSLIRDLVQHERVRQTFVLYGSEIGLIVLTFGTGILNSRFLGPQQYGIYTFVITVVEALMIFTGFGFPQAGARLVALSKSREQQQKMQGTLVLVALVMGAAMSVGLAFASPFIERLFHIQHKHSMVLVSLLSTTAPLGLVLLQACRGANQIKILAGFKIIPKGVYLVGAIAIVWFSHLGSSGALLLYYIGSVVAAVFVLFAVRVRFTDVKRQFEDLKVEVRRYGFKAYLGSIADNSTYKLNNLLIAGYVDTTWLGFYSIASTMVSPMSTFSSSLSSSVYRSLATKDRVSRKVFLLNTGFLIASGLFIVCCARPLISIVLTKSFLPATGLVYVLVFTAFFQGMYQPINAFLGAHGKGRELRAISFWVSLVNIGVAIGLVPFLGAYGAALGSSVAKLCELSGNVYYYRKITKSLQSKSEPVT
jgi:O-antigen/teichoic acid export membrane protein